jgi:GNAT superfamily N-acetyltransferase
MHKNLTFEILQTNELTPDQLALVVALCSRAYDEELTPLFSSFVDPTHILAFQDGVLVSHAMWVTRWLKPGTGSRLRTAYVEMVATEPSQQRRGFATAVMRRLANAISEYDLGALCPAEPAVYTKLGWVFWRGPLFIRSGERLMATPDERIMVLRLPKTPSLDLDQAISAEWREGELW